MWNVLIPLNLKYVNEYRAEINALCILWLSIEIIESVRKSGPIHPPINPYIHSGDKMQDRLAFFLINKLYKQFSFDNTTKSVHKFWVNKVDKKKLDEQARRQHYFRSPYQHFFYHQISSFFEQARWAPRWASWIFFLYMSKPDDYFSNIT